MREWRIGIYSKIRVYSTRFLESVQGILIEQTLLLEEIPNSIPLLVKFIGKAGNVTVTSSDEIVKKSLLCHLVDETGLKTTKHTSGENIVLFTLFSNFV